MHEDDCGNCEPAGVAAPACRGGSRIVRPVILGTWSPPVLACVRSWGRKGWPVGLIAVQPRDAVAPASRYLAAWCAIEPHRLETPQGFSVIRNFLEIFRADGIACIEERVGVWLQRESRCHGLPCTVWFPDAERLQRLLDKRVQIEAARQSGLRVLPTVIIDPPGHELRSIPQEFYPLCLRPAAGGVEPAFKVRVVSNREALEGFISGLKRLAGPLIGQPFQHLPNLVVHGARMATGRVMGLQGFLVPRKFEGVTLEIQPMPIPHDLEAGCRAFLKNLGVVGPFHFEFLWNPRTQKAWFLEVNNRLGGTTAKVLACGYDEPAYLLAAFGAAAPGDEHDGARVQGTASSRQALLKYLLYAVTGRLTPLDYPQESTARRVMHTLKALWGYRDDVAAADDLQGSLSLYWANVRPKLQSLLEPFRKRPEKGSQPARR